MKRGQVAIFIMVAVMLVVFVLGFFMLAKGEGEVQDPVVAEEVSAAIESCMKEASDFSFRYILLQGGTYEREDSDDLQIYKLANPVYKGGGMIWSEYEFSEKSVAAGMEQLIEEYFFVCANGIDFSDMDGNLSFGEYEVEVLVTEDKYRVTLDLPVTIKKLDRSFYKDEFVYERSVDFGEMESVVNDLVRESVESNEGPYDLIDRYNEKDGVEIDFFFAMEDYYFNNMVYVVKFFEAEYEVNFVVKFDWNEVTGAKWREER